MTTFVKHWILIILLVLFCLATTPQGRQDPVTDADNRTGNQTDWEFYRAALIYEVNGTVIRTTDQGLLVVTFVNKQSGEEKYGSVCAANFNWWRANTFCRYLGNEQGEWDSRSQNVKFVSDAWLRNNTNGSMILDDVSCKEIDDEIFDCHARILGHRTCHYSQSVWLSCSNSTDRWNPVVRGKYIPVDLEISYLHLRTDSIVGSVDSIVISYYDVEGRDAGGIGITFGSTVRYYLQDCHKYFTVFPTSVPAEQDKDWIIEKRGYRTKVYCNGEQVLDITTTSETCDDLSLSYVGTWFTFWGREVSEIKFSSHYDTASDSYNIERIWEFGGATLINQVTSGTEIATNNEGLLIATVVNKQTGIEQNGTVCKDGFNWHSAQLFCQSIGFLLADWGSYPRNMKYVPGSWLNKTGVPILMDDVSCTKGDTAVSMCNTRIMGHSCEYKDNIWLRCFNKTGCGDIKKWKASDKNCAVTNTGGFLKHLCFDVNRKQYYHKCVYSNVSYEQDDRFDSNTGSYTLSSVSSVCDNDPHVYQACGFSTKLTSNSNFLCGGYFSDELGKRFVECDRDCDIINHNYSGKNASQSPTDMSNITTVCDDKCDSWNCEDESLCYGHTYGVHCRIGDYTPVLRICDGYEDCYNREDESHCDITENITDSVHTCIHYNSKVHFGVNRIVPIFNNTRCSVFDLSSRYTYPYCYGYLDQTNCTDMNRVGGYCLINGFMSSVSKFVVCDSTLIQEPVILCDDNLDRECISPSDSTDCVVHKHKLCDGVIDCSDSSDEVNDICSRTTAGYLVCNRSFSADKYMEIPVSWIMDNQTDCIGGEDEMNIGMIRTCGIDETSRVIFGQGTCSDVFLCPEGSEKNYVEFDLLCDGVNSCEVENYICRISRDFPMVNTSVAIESCSVRNLCKAILIPENAACHIKEFEGPSGDVFGVRTMLNVPVFKVNCSRLFGEYYVFLSCMGLCLDSTCPLRNTSLNYDSCPGQYPDRVYTLANNSYLTFVTRSEEGEYENDYFQCKNSRCIRYSQVCDLVDDCGDMSDERSCTNHMICENTLNRTGRSKEQLISYSQKCDGIFDCFDLSDECNLSCGKEILNNWLLRLTCWLIGILAVILNAFTVTKVASSVKECKTGSLLYTRVLICLIGLGDFLVGVYLIALSVFDSIIHGKDYCRKQAEWLSGNACALLGVISTTGSQLSLFAMTSLSLILMLSFLTVPTRVNKRALTKTVVVGITIVAASLAVACIPLIPTFEDYFVQGMFYDPEYKVFIGFPNKGKHIKVLKAYYKNATVSQGITWNEIGEKVNGMFSQDYGNLSRSAVHFYGNDGVCLFKYFVRSDDPRRSRGSASVLEPDVIDNKGNAMVWLMLGVNLFCFMVITVSYLVINVKSRQSSKSSGQDHNPETARQNRAMQNRIAIIIGTDFACWVPFIIICFLHNLWMIDATHWYVTFALIVLPINSVINPLLYDNTLREFVDRKVRGARAMIGYSRIEATRLESVCTEPRDPPGDAALAKHIQSGDDRNEGTSPDIREIQMVSPEDINLETKM